MRTHAPNLLSWESTPPHARQKLVLHGYRPVGGRLDVPGTFLMLHNETVNIWSHLVAFGWMAHRTWETAVDGRTTADARLYTQVFHGCAAFTFCMSAVCHAFAPGLPPAQSAALWRWDSIGICTLATGSYVPALRFAFRCHPDWLLTYTALVAGLSGASLASLVLWRRETSPNVTSLVPPAFVTSIAVTCAFCLVPMLHWCSFAEPADRALLLPSMLGVPASYAIGFAFWKLCPLERAWAAGAFCYFGSHCVWHLAVVAAVALTDWAFQQVSSRPWDGSDCRPYA